MVIDIQYMELLFLRSLLLLLQMPWWQAVSFGWDLIFLYCTGMSTTHPHYSLPFPQSHNTSPVRPCSIPVLWTAVSSSKNLLKNCVSKGEQLLKKWAVLWHTLTLGLLMKHPVLRKPLLGKSEAVFVWKNSLPLCSPVKLSPSITH